MPFLKSFWNKKPSKMNNNLRNNDVVYISSDIEEIMKKQKACGGFSKTNMADIPGQTGVVKCVKNQCITVEVKGRQFDFHPDLLKCAPSGSSLPPLNTEYSSYEISIDNPNQSLPDPSINIKAELKHKFYNILRQFSFHHQDSFLPEVPTDDQTLVSICYSTSPYPTVPKYISNDNNQSLYDPPRDEEEIVPIEFDTSKIEPVPNIKMVDNKEIVIKAFDKFNIELVPDTKILEKKMCHKCQQNIIDYASDCGHCYCTFCKTTVINCISCSRPCTFIKIHL